MCYAEKPETIDALKENIREAIGEIQLHTIDYVLKNWTEGIWRTHYKGNMPESFYKEIQVLDPSVIIKIDLSNVSPSSYFNRFGKKKHVIIC